MKAYRFLLLTTALLLLLSGCSAVPGQSNAEKSQRQVYAMDTVMILTAYGDAGEDALEAAEARILALEADLDPEREGSSVRNVNQNAGGWADVSGDCLSIAATAAAVSEQSGGALAPQLYELIGLWGFISDNYRVPEQWEIDEALEHIDGFTLSIDSGNCAIGIPAGTSISYGAVAKGYTAAAALEAMAEAGCDSAILSLGGNVQTMGQKPDGSAWKVAVMDPDDTGDYVAMLSVGETAVVTSGDYQRYFVQDGVTYSHILDPKTGYPADSGLRSVTVVCENGALADALSTAMFVLGEEEALAYRDTYGGFELVLITTDGRIVVTDGLRDCLEETSENYRYEYPD